MGYWGLEISDNDSYADIYGIFYELYNNGMSVAEVSSKLIDDYQEMINDVDEGNNFWFALAKAQWECKKLDPMIYIKVKDIIETNKDLEVWRDLDADEDDIKERGIILHTFLEEISA